MHGLTNHETVAFRSAMHRMEKRLDREPPRSGSQRITDQVFRLFPDEQF